MTYTAEQLREWAYDRRGIIDADWLSDQLRAHADALEENARLKSEMESLEQALTDPENQPSQFGTVTLEWHEAELAKLRAEANDDDALRERMADILTRTAAALKGEPEPLTLHDWSGLPEIAELALTAERERADRNQEDAERLDWMDKSAFTAYRDRDPEYGELYDFATVVNEDRKGDRVGEVFKTIREAIDAARRK